MSRQASRDGLALKRSNPGSFGLTLIKVPGASYEGTHAIAGVSCALLAVGPLSKVDRIGAKGRDLRERYIRFEDPDDPEDPVGGHHAMDNQGKIVPDVQSSPVGR